MDNTENLWSQGLLLLTKAVIYRKMVVLRLVCVGLVLGMKSLLLSLMKMREKVCDPDNHLNMGSVSLDLPFALLSEGELGLCKRICKLPG